LFAAGMPPAGFLAGLKFELALSARSVRSTWADVADVPPRERALWRAMRPWHHLPLVGRWLPGNPYRCGSFGVELRRWGVELLTAGLFAAVAYVDLSGFVTPVDAALRAAVPADAAARWCLLVGHLVLVWGLVVATLTDLETMTIPDGSTVPTGLFAVAFATLSGRLIPVPVWFADASFSALVTGGPPAAPGAAVPAWVASSPHVHGFIASVVGLFVGGGIVWVVRVLGGWALGREAMGFGDVILMAMIGAFLGWQAVAAVFFLAPACACVDLVLTKTLRPSSEFPYGPSLAAGAVLLILAWPYVWPSVERACLLGPLLLVVAVTMTALLAVLLLLMRLLKRLAGLDDDVWYEDPPGRANVAPASVSDGWGRGEDWPGVAAASGRRGLRAWRGE
ncbi:MAG: A24 family peptidase, partial [Planctomycetota bacterium]